MRKYFTFCNHIINLQNYILTLIDLPMVTRSFSSTPVNNLSVVFTNQFLSFCTAVLSTLSHCWPDYLARGSDVVT